MIDTTFLIIAALLIVLFGAIFYAFSYNSIARQKKASARMKSLQVDPKTRQKQQTKKVDEKARRKMREDALKTVEKKANAEKEAANPPFPVKMTQAGLTMKMGTFYIYSVVAGFIATILVVLFTPMPLYVAPMVGVVVGFGLPRWVVGWLRNRRFNKFTLVFPNAIDVITRGIKSGLPLNDCMRIIAKDADEPVRGEFVKMIEAIQLGMTVPEAAQRMYHNVPTAETNFFAILLSIQSGAGGNLSEALGNLSKVLRERRKMSDKIKAVSMEAKTSAGIIGSLPIVVAILVTITSPGYLDPLFSTPGGHKILAGSALLMAFGIFVMKKMINFKF